jgi:putative methionine-R-sulfoxide reductase with GAF domain
VQIPIGARILAAVDCFDALASDRQYRKALPLPEAMAKVVADAGKSFDPQVVEILQRRYIELEKLATEQPTETAPKLSTDVKVKRGSAPDAGFAKSAQPRIATRSQNFERAETLNAARSAREELLNFKEQCPALQAVDLFSLLAVRLQHLVAYDALAAYCLENEMLAPAFVTGVNAHLFLALRIPLGAGLAGWVAQNHKAIVNGNPSVEPGYLHDPTKYSTLRSALAVPLEGTSGVIAVIALYRAGQDAFSPDDLHVVEALSAGLGAAVQANSYKPKSASAGAK